MFISAHCVVYHVLQGDALDFLVKNSFTEAAGSRKDFPKVAMVITDGKSQDPVEEYARRLRNIGVEIFVLGERGEPHLVAHPKYGKWIMHNFVLLSL